MAVPGAAQSGPLAHSGQFGTWFMLILLNEVCSFLINSVIWNGLCYLRITCDLKVKKQKAPIKSSIFILKYFDNLIHVYIIINQPPWSFLVF